MYGIIKAMLIKDLLKNEYVIGYHFKKRMNALDIVVSNGSIFYNLKKFEEKKFVTSEVFGRSKKYILTPFGREEFSRNLNLVPDNIELTMKKLGNQVPFINWTSHSDVLKFKNTIEQLNELLKQQLGGIK